MDLNIIKKLVKIVDTSEITDLEVEENGFKVKIAKNVQNSGVTGQPEVYYRQPLSETQTPQPVDTHTESKAPEKEVVSKDLQEVRSPIVGTFYRSPAPDADSYVQIGDMVSPGSVLCIVEAMKLMNEIESDIAGKIMKIMVDNGKPVEYNQPLFLIDTSV